MAEVGVYGLAIMGQNFALNLAEKGIQVSVSNRSPQKIESTLKRATDEGKDGPLKLLGFADISEFVKSVTRPRKIFLFVQAGTAVDDTIAHIVNYLESGDVIVDCGNEWYPNSIRRSLAMKEKGIYFVGMGVSGGEEGARYGPSLMPGGDTEAYDLLEPILSRVAAQIDDGCCCTNIGPIGSGNYVKMVHNGIEYGDMQLIAEIYHVLKTLAGCSNSEISQVFEEWNTGELQSYLVEITARIMVVPDDVTGEGCVVDKIMDSTGMKGTGRWTVQEAAERSVAAPTVAAALDARYLSSLQQERLLASDVLRGPLELPRVERAQIIADCKQALYAAKICSYAQGLSLIRAASKQMGWNINLAECARIWKGGCIIRARFLGELQEAFTKSPDLANAMIDPAFAVQLARRQTAWRRIITLCVASGVPCPALSASLCYYDSYRCKRLPANLTQAQRDFFGGHSYERLDMAGSFHTIWSSQHKDIGNISERTAGNL